jgi:hypothetical protein
VGNSSYASFFQILGKLKRFIPILPQDTFSLNPNVLLAEIKDLMHFD